MLSRPLQKLHKAMLTDLPSARPASAIEDLKTDSVAFISGKTMKTNWIKNTNRIEFVERRPLKSCLKSLFLQTCLNRIESFVSSQFVALRDDCCSRSSRLWHGAALAAVHQETHLAPPLRKRHRGCRSATAPGSPRTAECGAADLRPAEGQDGSHVEKWVTPFTFYLSTLE